MNKFKVFLEKEFEESKNYKQEMKWFDGVWSRFTPTPGKDRRGITGVSNEKIIALGKKITTLPKNFTTHKTLEKIFEKKQKMFTHNMPIDIRHRGPYLQPTNAYCCSSWAPNRPRSCSRHLHCLNAASNSVCEFLSSSESECISISTSSTSNCVPRKGYGDVPASDW